METRLSSILLLREAIDEGAMIALLETKRPQTDIITDLPVTRLEPNTYKCGVDPHEVYIEVKSHISELNYMDTAKSFISIYNFVSDHRDIDFNMASEFTAFDVVAILFRRYRSDVWAAEDYYPPQAEDPELKNVNIAGKSGYIWTADQFYTYMLKPFYKDNI
ncbi:hypothetical protein KDL29_15065 [bacterium]|nr:hypothetical protein [bacterium]